MIPGLLILVLATACTSEITPDGLHQQGFLSCFDRCPNLNKKPCQVGCQVAEKLSSKPENAKHGITCQSVCTDRFTRIVERNACQLGCLSDPVENRKEPIKSQLVKSQDPVKTMFPSLESLLNAMKTDVPMPEIPKVVRTIIGKFFGMKDGEETANPAEKSGVQHMLIEPPTSAENKSPAVHISKCYKFRTMLRDWSSNPLKLLLLFTLTIAMVLLLVQFVLHCMRRNRNQRVNEFNRIPTYAQAVDIKIPPMKYTKDEKVAKNFNACEV